jgi:restriction system protein
MIEGLKKQPKDIFNITPRQYEELVAELMHDMGYEVTLTPATRDGGKDILAFDENRMWRFPDAGRSQASPSFQ